MFKVRDFAQFGPSGIEMLYCKFCGKTIGRMDFRPIERVPGPIPGHVIERVAEKFIRLADYTEAKIACHSIVADGRLSAHITHGCWECLNKKYTVEELRQIVELDHEEMGLEHGGHGDPISIVKIKRGGGIP